MYMCARFGTLVLSPVYCALNFTCPAQWVLGSVARQTCFHLLKTLYFEVLSVMFSLVHSAFQLLVWDTCSGCCIWQISKANPGEHSI